MILNDEVIVLGIVPYKEQNVILKTYTKSLGIQSFYLSKSKSKNSAKNNFSVFSILDIQYQKGKTGGLAKILESKIKYPLLEIRFNIQKSAIAMLLAEILGKCIREEEANIELYLFLELQILNLENTPDKFSNLYLFLLCGLMKFFGLQPEILNNSNYFNLKEGTFSQHPSNDMYTLNQAETNYLKQFLSSTWEEAKLIQMNARQRIELLHHLLLYYKLHFGGFENPKSLDIITEVFHS